MSDKVTLQAISDIFSNQYGISKKTSDAFGKSFFDTIVEGLNNEGLVKISGLGTFKIVEVGSRESVNVTNGERIVIDGYRKVTFIPDEFVVQKNKEQMKCVEAEVTMAGNQVVLDEVDKKTGTKKTEEDLVKTSVAEVEEKIIDDSEPERIEQVSDEFSGIDMLISTPESVQELQNDIMLARIRAEQTLEEAKIANMEYRRLEMLYDRLKKGTAPETLSKEISTTVLSLDMNQSLGTPQEPEENLMEETIAEERLLNEAIEVEMSAMEKTSNTTPTKDSSTDDEFVEHASREQAFNRYISDSQIMDVQEFDDEDEYEESSYKKLFIIIPLVGVLFAAIVIFGYRFYKYNIPTNEIEYDNVVPVTKSSSHSQETLIRKKDFLHNVANKDTSKTEDMQPIQKPENVNSSIEAKTTTESKKQMESKSPKTYTIQKGESLTRISQKIYNTKDSVNAIIKLNNFADPNNVPIGTVIKLP